MKVVINRCFGGFGLSKEAVLRYAEIKGIKLFIHDKYLMNTYLLVPFEEYEVQKEKDTVLRDYSKSNEMCFSVRDIKRNDPVLIQVVKELKKKANEIFADLHIVTIPDGIEWEIDEYDGLETVEEKHRSWN